MAQALPTGGITVEDGLEWYRIDHVDHLEPFLANVTSPYDHWLFVSSSGALTGGRRNAGHALFPYETDDRLHRSGGRTGPVTIVRARRGSDDAEVLWEPFAPHVPLGVVERSLAKTVEGDRLRFTERHPGLGLTFHATWSTSQEHGLVRHCRLELDAEAPDTTLSLLDGLVDVLPAEVELALQQSSSTLVDAYRRSELDAASGLAVFSLEAAISDHAQAAEAMTANVVWSRGLDGATVALSDRQVRTFRSGRALRAEPLATGVKGAFLQAVEATLAPGGTLAWVVVADVSLDHVAVASRRRWLLDEADVVGHVDQAVQRSHDELVRLAAAQDALQRTADREADAHHFANVLYNAMRGGAFLDGHVVEVDAVREAIAVRNAPAGERYARVAAGLPGRTTIAELRAHVAGDGELLRLVNEYLPLVFSRRHGDPSRPWNRFEIPTRTEDGRPVTGYQGNWRDIFQNWEALLHGFPDYLESAVSKFLSASTRDGHNPYRIDHEGVDWEVPEEGSWGNFGYWGDHQVVYLLRLLEALDRFRPGVLEGALGRRAFSHADVPYRMRSWDAIVADPKRTLDFDWDRQREIDKRVVDLGTDGRLVPGPDGEVHHASLAEKLLVPALAKLANLVPGGGIWMNTQRPEWNDANNALVGNGLSVVTSFHLRDYLAFVLGLLERTELAEVPVDPVVLDWLRATRTALEAHEHLLAPEAIGPRERRSLLDALGGAYGAYRAAAYDEPPAAPDTAAVDELAEVVRTALAHVEVVTSTAEREDGLLDAYRLLVLGEGTAEVRPLYPMLEGQVAALDSPTTSPRRAAELVDALFASDLHRQDHGSFVLYPDRRPPSFLERNRVPLAELPELLRPLAEGAGDGLLRVDADGVVRFAARIGNRDDLLDALADAGVDEPTREALLDLHEQVFDHRSFTGRSQSMYRYEGLGSIYWHMVAKLLAAVQRRLAAVDDRDDPELRERLRRGYHRIRDGLGFRQPVAVQGAFPLDPHSHTPAHAGAQQPGMTGAVKEGVLVRLGELGVEVADGVVGFRPVLLRHDDFLTSSEPWAPLGEGGALAPGTLGFTWCGVPIVYHLADEPWVRVVGPDIEVAAPGCVLDPRTSRLLTSRSGAVSRVDVGVVLPTERT